MRSWPANDAKTSLGRLLGACVREGPQQVTWRGEIRAVLVPVEEWRRLTDAPRPSIKELLLTDFARGELMTPDLDVETIDPFARG